MPNGCRHYAFTCNNYTEDDLDAIARASDKKRVDYIIYGKEVAGSGTPHLQGQVCFSKQTSLKTALKTLGIKTHLTKTKYLDKSIEYCKKDGDWTHFGTPPFETKKPGQRSDLEAFKTAVKEGRHNLDKKKLRDEFSSVAAQCPRFFADFIDDHLDVDDPVQTHPLREWQQELYSRLTKAPDPRHIIFVVDTVGNQGKSWFARYYCDLHDNSQIVVPGKKADMAIFQRNKVFFFDCPRSKQGDFIQYDFIEELKNGYIFSPKYESKVKKLKVPHIVVCMNEHPDMTKLSEDRYSKIYTLNSDGSFNVS